VAEESVQAWQTHLEECERCRAVIKRGERALLYNLCSTGQKLYYPAWQVDGRRTNPGAAS
jgi:hypothetical protein